MKLRIFDGLLDRWPFPPVGARCAAWERIHEVNCPVALAATTETSTAVREPEELEEDDPPSDEPAASNPTVALSLETQGWDEWEEQCFSEWHPRG